MAKIKKISQTKRITPTTKLISNLSIKAKEHQKKHFETSYKHKQQLKKRPMSLDEHLKLLGNVLKVYTNKLTVANAFEYIDKERIKRAKEQLKVFYLNNMKKGVFNFVVKSSGLTSENSSYFVKIQFKEAEILAHTEEDYNQILLNSRIGIECTCEDFKYRFRYWVTQMKALPDGAIHEYRYPKITNKDSEHLFLCKHCALVLNGIQKPSFKDNIFKRYIMNLRKGKKQVKVTQKDKFRTLRASKVMKFKEDKE
jgi:hypothetical protein